MSPDLDALRRTDVAVEAPRRSRAGLLTGLVLALGALGWAFLLAKNSIFPARQVTTARVRVEAGVGAARRATRVEATGWIEPDPFPSVVRPHVDGIVESIDVLEGASVEAGAVVARLSSATLLANVARAERTLAHRRSHVVEAEAEAAEAAALLEQRLDLRREVARIEGEIALSTAGKAEAEAELRVAEHALAAAETELRAQESLLRQGSGIPLSRDKAAAAAAGAAATVEAKRAEVGRLDATRAAAGAQLSLAKEALEAPRALEGAVAKTKAHVAAATADVEAAATDLEIAKRESGWLVVTAPVAGVVLRREAAPGSTVGPSSMPRGGEGGGADSGMGGIVSLYDPKRLQARVDVPLSTVGAVGVGQKAEISVEALPGRTFHGAVTRVQQEADSLKNTLQVKVRIDDPDPLLRPEMLVRARFLADAAPAAGEGSPSSASSSSRIVVPKRALKGDAVFVIDPRGGGRARRIPVSKVAEDAETVEVSGDLSATQEVILDDGVADGDRVKGGGS